MKTEIKPGPELDQAVAEAIGMIGTCTCHTRAMVPYQKLKPITYHCGSCGQVAGVHHYQPFSTDLNAAFAAAEKVGLFDENRLYRDKRTGQYGLDPTNIMSGRLFPMAPTPALAICAAILKLEESE